jgi:CheY-like chemotaxis protein
LIALTRSPGLVVLDLMLPGLSGLEVCSSIRMLFQKPNPFPMSIFEQLVEDMSGDTTMVDPCMHQFSVPKHLERIADLAANVAEEVIYLERPGFSTSFSSQE